MSITELAEAVIDQLTTELQMEEAFNEELLETKVNSAITEIKNKRRYPSSYTEEMIASDLSQFQANIANLALFDYDMVGAQGESSHGENGVSRTYIDRRRLFSGIVPLASFV
jgi:hypothetical protein